MTQEQQRIAIAEARGWKRHFGDGVIVSEKAYVWIDPNGRRTDGLWKPDDDTQFCRVGIPNYLKDLNAMHETEKHIPYIHGQTYFTHLREIVFRDLCATEEDPDYYFFGCWHSSAAQRAEAFLRTFDLWKE